MLKNYLTIAFRTLRRHKGYTAITVSSLALGMACCLLILMLVRHEWSFDRFHSHADRIHRVLIQETRPDGSLDHRVLMPPPLAPEMAREFAGIERLTRVVAGNRDVRHGDRRTSERLFMVDSTFFEIFTFPLLAGDPATALDDPQGLVLTVPAARKYFGGDAYADMLGRTLSIERGENAYEFTVTGVLAPLPATSSFQFDLLLSFRQYETLPIGSNDWGGRTSLYVLLAPGQDPAALEAAFPPFTAVQFAERIDGRRQGGFIAEGADAFQLVLQPLRAMHLEPGVQVRYEVATHNPRYSYVLAGIALLVLLIACVNFVTLSVGRSAQRAREVGLRKVLGAVREQVMRQFWGEALLLSGLALIVSVLLVLVALPTFNTLTGKAFSARDLVMGSSLLMLVGLTGLVAFGAGGYPAAVLSRFQPAAVLKGDRGAYGPRRFSRTLVVLQYTISIALIICTLTMYRQLDYLLTKDLGFDGEQVVVVQTPRLTTAQERTVLEAFRSELGSDPQVEQIVRTGYAFTHSYDTRSWNAADGAPFRAHMVGADYDYLDVLGMELVAGRNFSPAYTTDSTRSVLVNEAFVRAHDLSDPVGYVLTGFDGFFGDVDPTIIGVVKDFNFQSLHQEVEPAVINMHPDYYMGMQAMLVKIRPDDIAGVLARLEDTWRQVFPEKPFTFSFLDADMDAQYQAERRWRTILADAALIAVLIACMGLFGLATLSIAQRTKEIGVRKVLGATIGGIAVLVVRDFALLVGLSTLIAWPLAYISMHRWLDTFAYRVDLSPLTFLGAGLATLAVALLTVSYQTYRAATMDPVRSLRSL